MLIIKRWHSDLMIIYLAPHIVEISFGCEVVGWMGLLASLLTELELILRLSPHDAAFSCLSSSSHRARRAFNKWMNNESQFFMRGGWLWAIWAGVTRLDLIRREKWKEIYHVSQIKTFWNITENSKISLELSWNLSQNLLGISGNLPRISKSFENLSWNYQRNLNEFVLETLPLLQDSFVKSSENFFDFSKNHQQALVNPPAQKHLVTLTTSSKSVEQQQQRDQIVYWLRRHSKSIGVSRFPPLDNNQLLMFCVAYS